MPTGHATRKESTRRPIPTRGRGERSVSSTIVRHLRPTDADRLLAASPLFDHALHRAVVAQYLAERANHVWLAYRASRPVGFLRGTELLQVETRAPQFFLYEISVAKEHRRNGVGSDLVHAMIRFIRRRGHAEAFVFTSPSNRAAVRLYRSKGGVTETDADRMFVYPLLQEGDALSSQSPRGRRRK